MCAPLLVVSGLAAGYGDIRLFVDVAIQVGAGEIVALIGSNVAGKCTLMRALSALLPPRASDVWLVGANVRPASSSDLIAREIVHVGDDHRAFLGCGSTRNKAYTFVRVAENIDY